MVPGWKLAQGQVGAPSAHLRGMLAGCRLEWQLIPMRRSEADIPESPTSRHQNERTIFAGIQGCNRLARGQLTLPRGVRLS